METSAKGMYPQGNSEEEEMITGEPLRGKSTCTPLSRDACGTNSFYFKQNMFSLASIRNYLVQRFYNISFIELSYFCICEGFGFRSLWSNTLFSFIQEIGNNLSSSLLAIASKIIKTI